MRLNGAGQFGRLSGGQVKSFLDALLDAFPAVPMLDQMLLIYVQRNRQGIALGDDLNEIVFKVIATAEAESWTAELLAGARSARPDNDALLLFAQQFGLAPATGEGKQLERQIREANGALHPVAWRQRMGIVEGQVCRVEVYSGSPPEYGTGFLVGPNVIMTNYHVIEAVHRGEVAPTKVALRFDYKQLANGPQVHGGTVYELSKDGDWLLDHSPYSPVDESGAAKDPEPVELDYALLRVAGAPGDDPVGGPDIVLPKPNPRGWIEAPIQTHDFERYPAIMIMQHLGDGPLKFAFDTQSVIAVNGNRTRVRYRTTTQPGASGSPCFDSNWNLIAIHQAGDPNYQRLRKADYNQGIPMAAIVALMKQRKTFDRLGRS